MTHSRPVVRELLASRGLAPRRDLGQNFVADPNTVRRIAHLAGVGAGDRVVEIGAGLGSLTLALAETGATVTAVEVDRGLAAALREVVAGVEGITVVEADAMTLDWPALLGAPGPDGGDWVLVANLPYNVATPLVADLLDDVPAIGRMLVMVQREVGERLVAAPGSKAYGAISVKVAYWATARLVGFVPAAVFMPRPKVESALVEIIRHEPPDVAPDELFALVRTAFGQRRKMLRRSLADVVGRRALRRGRCRRDGAARGARPRRLGAPRPIGTGGVTAVGGDDAVVTVRAPAKLTLTLRITGVREDGYHLLDADMITLDLADILTIDPAGSGITVSGPYAEGVPTDASNLIAGALALVGRTAGVHVDKQIPHGGGLGGGSADAAAILRWGGFSDLLAASRLGADVPFCLVGGRARVRGIGEIVEPVRHQPMDVTLVIPPVHVRTPAVYRAWDELGGPTGKGPNDLEPAAVFVAPELAHWRDRIGRLAGVAPVLAGSGATWFVPGKRDDALASLRGEGVAVVVARTARAAG